MTAPDFCTKCKRATEHAKDNYCPYCWDSVQGCDECGAESGHKTNCGQWSRYDIGGKIDRAMTGIEL